MYHVWRSVHARGGGEGGDAAVPVVRRRAGGLGGARGCLALPGGSASLDAPVAERHELVLSNKGKCMQRYSRQPSAQRAPTCSCHSRNHPALEDTFTSKMPEHGMSSLEAN